MGILAPEKGAQTSPVATRRKSSGLDFGNLKPLNATTGTTNFRGYRDPAQQSPKSKKKIADAMDSDADDEDDVKAQEVDDDKDPSGKGMLSPEDALRQGELAEGVRKIKVRKPFPTTSGLANKCQLKRQHSAEPLNQNASPAARDTSGSPVSGAPASAVAESSTAATKSSAPDLGTEGTVGSPFKKQRASLPGFEDSVRKSLGAALLGVQKERGNSEGDVPASLEAKMEEDDEL